MNSKTDRDGDTVGFVESSSRLCANRSPIATTAECARTGGATSSSFAGRRVTPKGVEKCQTSRATNMDGAYRAFEGVREITAAADQLQDARDALETITVLDILTRRGVDVGDVIIAHGRLAR
jgi:hypothetical protein